MANFVFNIAKGMVGYYAGLPGTNDALVAIPIEAAGIEDDAVLVDYDNVGLILSGASNEQATMGRVTLTGVTTTVDDAGDKRNADADDIEWPSATGNATAALIIAYDPDTTGGTDADLVPLVKLDMAATPAGADVTFQFNAEGFYRAS